MRISTDATIAKSLLLNFQIYVKSLSEQGPTDLTIYAENFAAKLMEVYYGYPFVNMNYASKNIAGIDLLNQQNKHAIQFTIQENNADKVVNTLKKSNGYNKITVFFLSIHSTKTIAKHLKEKNEWQDNLEVISLVNIFSSMEQDPHKAVQYKELCELWINGEKKNYGDIIEKYNMEMKKRIQANIKSKKYIPEIYIPEKRLKDNCRNFADPAWATQLLLHKIPTYYVGYCYKLLKNAKMEFENGTQISFKEDCDALSLLNQKNSEIHISSIIEKLENYMHMNERIRSEKLLGQDDKELSLNEKFANYTNGVSHTINSDLQQYDFSKKKFFFIVKDAGQGKTNFLCDFADNVLAKRKVPTVYLNVNELTKNLLDTVKDQISFVSGRDFVDAIRIIEQYCTVVNKKLLICIDGLNEQSDLAGFKNEVLELFRFADGYDFIKIVATTRNKAYETYFSRLKDESFGEVIAESIEIDQKMGGRKSEYFKRKVYRKYRKYFNITCQVSSEARRKLSNDTLLLRIFSEVYENNSEAFVNDIFLYDLFDAYIKKRSAQLLYGGRIKREDDLRNLLHKISRKMIETHDLNGFTRDGFSADENNLIDLIVQEDIILKSSDDNGITFFGSKEVFSFTYDEFRDFLLAGFLLNIGNQEFENEIKTLYSDAERYDGVLKFLFLFCKTRSDKRLSILEKYPEYARIYTENIFSIEDRFLSKKDVNMINRALQNQYEDVYEQVIKRLDLTKYTNVSVMNIVNIYINDYLGDFSWNKVFLKRSYSHQEWGILPELLRSKYEDTSESEVYGILLLLCTIGYSDSKERYLIWLKEKYPKQCMDALSKISSEYSSLAYKVQSMM